MPGGRLAKRPQNALVMSAAVSLIVGAMQNVANGARVLAFRPALSTTPGPRHRLTRDEVMTARRGRGPVAPAGLDRVLPGAPRGAARQPAGAHVAVSAPPARGAARWLARAKWPAFGPSHQDGRRKAAHVSRLDRLLVFDLVHRVAVGDRRGRDPRRRVGGLVCDARVRDPLGRARPATDQDRRGERPRPGGARAGAPPGRRDLPRAPTRRAAGASRRPSMACLLLGPPRSGKTTGVIVPALLSHAGAGGLDLDQARRAARNARLPRAAGGGVAVRPHRRRLGVGWAGVALVAGVVLRGVGRGAGDGARDGARRRGRPGHHRRLALVKARPGAARLAASCRGRRASGTSRRCWSG